MLKEFSTYRGINCKKTHTFLIGWFWWAHIWSCCQLLFSPLIFFSFSVFQFFSINVCVNMSNASWAEERRRSCVDVLAAWSAGSWVPQCVLLQQFVVCHHHCATLQCFAVLAGNQWCPPSGPKTLRWLKFLSTGTMSSLPAVVHSLHFPQLKWSNYQIEI